MKFLATFSALFSGRASTAVHNDNLRAGQYPEPVLFLPWKTFVS
jgi:hypothetical protein